MLLDTNAVDVNARSTAGQSPIIFAAAYDHKDVVTLLEANAYASFVDEDGRTPCYGQAE